MPPDQCSQAPGARSRPTQHRQACRSRSLALGPCRAAGLRTQLAASAEGAPHGVAGCQEPACPSPDARSGPAKAGLSRIGRSGASWLCGHQAATAYRTRPIACRCGRASESPTFRAQHADRCGRGGTAGFLVGHRLMSASPSGNADAQPSVARRPLVRALTAVVNGYQRGFSSVFPPSCRYWPSCSEYAIEALQLHGVAKGSWLTLRRLCRCHPWGGHGVDPVPLPAPSPGDSKAARHRTS